MPTHADAGLMWFLDGVPVVLDYAQANWSSPNRGAAVPDTLTRQDLCPGAHIFVSPCDTIKTASGKKFPAVSGQVTLCVDDRDVIYFSGEADSIVWYFRNSDIVGVFISDNLDPDHGYVRIGGTQTIYNPADDCSPAGTCVSWQTDWCERIFPGLRHNPSLSTLCSPNGFYLIVAWIYAGKDRVCASNPLEVIIKNPSR